MSVPPDPRWQRRASVAFVDSVDRVALLDLDRPAEPAQLLEGPAAAIWRLVDGSRSTAEVVREVAAQFGVAPDEVRVDVEGFVASLAARGLVEAGSVEAGSVEAGSVEAGSVEAGSVEAR